jgi:glycosyltransferase involved in cell wall biosynthesis
MKAAILTDFVSHDPAYSLCTVVGNQVKMLAGKVDELTLFVRQGYDPMQAALDYPGVNRIVVLDPGQTGSNTVEVTDRSEQEITQLETQFIAHFSGLDVVLTHDLIYQANMWKYHVALRRYIAKHDRPKFLHWVHSSTDLGTAKQTGKYQGELQGRMPHSRLVAMHPEEINRKGAMFGYERDQIVVVPNPLDIMEDYAPLTRDILGPTAWEKDCIIVYPARLDRGKQVEVIGEIGAALNDSGWSTLVIVVDFHSTGGDKAAYRKSLEDRFGWFMRFTSALRKESSYHVPHKTVMDLFDYADVFVHPSVSESDPLTVPEAMWKRNLMVLNFDLPVFRQYDGRALFGKFSSAIDVNTGLPGSTTTEYKNREAYMRSLAQAIAYMLGQDTVLKNHRSVRQTRSLEAVAAKDLLPALDGAVHWMR